MDSILQDQRAPAAFATRPDQSRGRLYPETPSATRNEFQRDRDRIIHCGAFRKLRNKTQVFIENEGDYYRTRLTHSLEVAQLARTMARSLGLNEDLTETIALAHDLGHTCFGHAGEWALDEVMRPYGGFSHNEQTFRILTKLEERYIPYDGLNLTWETLEGVVKHNGPVTKAVPQTIQEFNLNWDLELQTHASAEAQIAALADDVAYNSHDLDDGYRAGLFTLHDIAELPLFGLMLIEVEKQFPDAPPERIMQETVRQVIGAMIADLLTTTRANLLKLKPATAADIRHAGMPVVGFSDSLRSDLKLLREFLMTRMYRHSSVNRICAKAETIVKEMFLFLMDRPVCLPEAWHRLILRRQGDDHYKARKIADYIAGMTDRFAVQEHRRLFSTETMI